MPSQACHTVALEISAAADLFDTSLLPYQALDLPQPETPRCMSVADFCAIVCHWQAEGAIGTNTIVQLQLRGDPLAHPQFAAIAAWLEAQGLCYSIATSAQTLPDLQLCPRMEHLRSVVFSMAAYYDPLTCTETCCSLKGMQKNIFALMTQIRTRGFRGTVSILLPPVAMDIDRHEAICDFAFRAGMHVMQPRFAALDLELVCTALSGGLTKEACEALPALKHFLAVRQHAAPRPAAFSCPAHGDLCIDAGGNILLCRYARHSTLGKACEMQLSQWRQRHDSHEQCRLCHACGADYVLTTVPEKEEPARIAGMPDRVPFLTPGGRWVWLDPAEPQSSAIRQDVCAARLRHFCRSFIKAHYVGIDIGARDGYYSTFFAKLAAKGKVYALEPSLLFQTILQHSIQINGLHNLLVLPYALAGAPENSPSSNPAARSLDELSKRFVMPRLDFIRIDAGGDTPFILAGCMQLIERYDPLIMLALAVPAWEGKGKPLPEFFAWLEGQGFVCFSTAGKELQGMAAVQQYCAAGYSHLLLRRSPLTAVA